MWHIVPEIGRIPFWMWCLKGGFFVFGANLFWGLLAQKVMKSIRFITFFLRSKCYSYIGGDEMEICYFIENNFDKQKNGALRKELYEYVKEHAAKLLEISPDYITICKSEYGKPYITKTNHKLYFNISHTKGAGIVFFSKKEVGCDIEKVSMPDYRIADRFFSEDEKRCLYGAYNKKITFYEIWTRKEAFVKWLGVGFRKPLNSFNVFHPDICPNMGTVFMDGYVVSVYGQNIILPIQVKKIEKNG